MKSPLLCILIVSLFAVSHTFAQQESKKNRKAERLQTRLDEILHKLDELDRRLTKLEISATASSDSSAPHEGSRDRAERLKELNTRLSSYLNASEDQKAETRKLIGESLRQGKCTITFYKSDGSKRIMQCTLKQDLLPPDKRPRQRPENSPITTSSVIQNVFDLEAQDWRSFRFDRLVSVEF